MPRHVSLRLVELVQDKDGQFRVSDPSQQNLTGGLQQSTSCLKWLSFETGTQHDVQITKHKERNFQGAPATSCI